MDIVTYFCPKCGQSISASAARREDRRVTFLLCPDCRVRLEVHGIPLMLIGGLIWICFSLILSQEGPAFGAIVGIPLIAVGIMRLVRQALMLRRRRQG